jgi:cytochrome c oxidase assembly protein subunit 15
MRLAHGLACATVGATLVLILFGGLVTNTGAALAVPDWPTTFGHPMFLFPWSAMVGGVFYEHSHRLLGALVGVLTLTLAVALARHGRPLAWLGLVAVVVVGLQGVLGGLRVVLREEPLAIVHGCLAQAFFALVAALAFLTSRHRQAPARGVDPALRGFTVLTAALIYVQIVFGALVTHAGRLDLHLGGAVAVLVLSPMVTARLVRTGDPVAAPLSRVLLALLLLQLGLGSGSFLARFTPLWLPGEQLTGLALPVAHRLVASLILGAAVVLAVRAAAREPATHPEVGLGPVVRVSTP